MHLNLNEHLVKKKKLVITGPLEDATLLGITSVLKAHRLAWLINKTTALKLVKVEDLYFETPDCVGSYAARFLFSTEHCTYRLMQNKSMTKQEGVVNYLISKMRYIDFFFSVQDFTQTFDSNVFCSALKATNKINHITSLNWELYRDKDHLFFD